MSPDPLTDGNGRRLAVPAVLGGVACYQLGAAIAKSLFPVLGATGTAGLRISLSAVILCVLWRPWRRWPGAEAMSAVVPYGVSLGLMNLLFYLALARLPLGVAVCIEFTGPLALAALGSRRPLDLAWTALAAIGLMLLLDPRAAQGTPPHRTDPLGVGYALGAGLCWALYILFGRRLGRQFAGGQGTALGMTVASLVVVPFCAPAMMPVLADAHRLLAATAVAVLCSALPYSLEMAALRHLSTRTFGILMSLDPAMAALSGLLLLGEQLSPQRWIAVLCIVLASAGSALEGRSAAAIEP